MALAQPFEAGEVVVVHDPDQIAEAEIGGHHHRLPGRAFLELAVAQHAVDHRVGAFELLGIGHADRDAEPVPKRAGRGGNTGRAVIGMGAEPAADLAVKVEILLAQHAGLFEDHVLDHAAMTLGHQKDVARAAVRVTAQQAVLDRVDDFGAGKSRRHMQGPDLLRDVEYAAAIAPAAHPRRLGVEAVAQHRLSPAARSRSRHRGCRRCSAGPRRPSGPSLRPSRFAAPSRHRV